MVKDTNTRNMVTITKYQASIIRMFAEEFNISTSKVIAGLVNILTNDITSDEIANLLRNELNSNSTKRKKRSYKRR